MNHNATIDESMRGIEMYYIAPFTSCYEKVIVDYAIIDNGKLIGISAHDTDGYEKRGIIEQFAMEWKPITEGGF